MSEEMKTDLDNEAEAIAAAEAAAKQATEDKDAATANAEEAKADETAEGQEYGDSPDPEDEEAKKSRSQRQRERRKAYIAELETKAKDAQERLERLKKAHEGRAEPKEDAYDDPTEYAVARVLWQQRHADASEQTEAVKAEYEQVEQQRQQELHDAWQERVAEAAPKYEDYHKVALDPAVPVTPDMADIIMRSEVGTDVLYHLGSHREIAARIASLPPSQQAYELGRIESRLAAPKPRTATSAPEPIKPVGGRSTGEKDPSKMTMAEYKAWRAKGGK